MKTFIQSNTIDVKDLQGAHHEILLWRQQMITSSNFGVRAIAPTSYNEDRRISTLVTRD